MEEDAQRMEKIFSSYTSDKGLVTRMYRKLKKLNSPKFNDPMKKWARTELSFFKGRSPNSQKKKKKKKKHIKKCSTNRVIRERQIKMVVRLHFTPVRMATVKNTHKKITNVDKDEGKRNIAGGNVN
jgi:hypothetical protein